MKRLLIALSVTAIAVGALTPAVAGAKSPPSDPQLGNHNLTSPLQEKQAALKQAAFEAVLSGQATPSGKNKVVKVAPGQFVELAFEGEDQILTLLGQFGGDDPTHTHTDGPAATHTGDAFARNSIPQPDRDVDNTTIWTADFNQAHYDNLLYNKNANPSMANFYLEQSSGKYSVDGFVGDWVTVPNNPSAYGSDYCGSIVCRDTWLFVNDQADAWWSDLVADTGSPAAANAFLATFDIWDRYDSDGDSNFNEPDGYIDHFQSVHAGEGQEVGGGALGSDAIWSHRWYAWFPGTTSPDAGSPNGFGGLRIGSSDYWIGDYTIEPENGGVGVFAHEFAHDLGLPDLYATQGGENSTAWWTIMSQGSYGTVNGEDLGSAPTHFGAWEKLQLGFLNSYSVATNESSGTYHLGPAEFNSKKPQAMFIVLPDKEVETNIGAPYAGTMFYYSGTEDNLDTTMTRDIALPGGAVSLSAKVRYNIEEDFDFAYLMVDGDLVATNLSNSSVVAEGIEGHSGGNWVDLTADLSAYAGGTHEIGFGYFTDGGVQGQSGSLPPGFALDDLQITRQPLDGAETDPGWTYDSNQDVGFHRSTGIESASYFNAYVLENRQYLGYDEALELGPYNFGFPSMPDYVEHFPYQDGLLISYWDNSFGNNNTPQHPGGGLILPVDSHPAIETWTEGTQMRPRIQSYDSTFTKAATDGITLHNPTTGVAKTIASKPAVSVFNDALRDGDGTSIYWAPGVQAGWNGVNVPNTGTKVVVKSISSTGLMVIDLNK